MVELSEPVYQRKHHLALEQSELFFLVVSRQDTMIVIMWTQCTQSARPPTFAGLIMWTFIDRG